VKQLIFRGVRVDQIPAVEDPQQDADEALAQGAAFLREMHMEHFIAVARNRNKDLHEGNQVNADLSEEPAPFRLAFIAAPGVRVGSHCVIVDVVRALILDVGDQCGYATAYGSARSDNDDIYILHEVVCNWNSSTRFAVVRRAMIFRASRILNSASGAAQPSRCSRPFHDGRDRFGENFHIKPEGPFVHVLQIEEHPAIE
jgi:hypothetical protein